MGIMAELIEWSIFDQIIWLKNLKISKFISGTLGKISFIKSYVFCVLRFGYDMVI